MNACSMSIEATSDGGKVLTGVLSHSLERGTILVLRRVGERYELRACNKDKRQADRSEQSLWSFVLPSETEQSVRG